MSKRSGMISNFLPLLAASSVGAAWAGANGASNNTGRPIYPYKIATTKAERMAHVKRRQSNNGQKSGERNFRHWMKRHEQSKGPSRKMFVPYDFAVENNLLAKRG